MFLQQVAVFLIYIQTFAENIQVSVDRCIDEIAANSNDNHNTYDSDDQWCEVQERPSGVTDTLFQQGDFTQI